jgi:hypothetical protein
MVDAIITPAALTGVLAISFTRGTSWAAFPAVFADASLESLSLWEPRPIVVL